MITCRRSSGGPMILLAVVFGMHVGGSSAPAATQPGGRSRPDVMLSEHLIDGSLQGPSGLDLCDIDRDGLLDVVASDYVGGQIAWWRNDGSDPVQWSRNTVGPQFAGAIDVVAGDVDGDLDIDLAGAAWYGHEVAWWENGGGDPIEWTKHSVATAQTNAHEVWIQDMDGDLDADILAAVAGTHSIMLWLNDGGEWAAQTVATGFTGARSVFVCDLDDDGDPDVLGAALAASRVTWWRNDGGSPIQWSEFNLSTTYGGAHQVSACDIDRDGDLDVLAAGYSSPTLCWWRNDGGDPISWSRQTIDTFPGAVVAYAADLDDDGCPDVVATAQDPSDIAWWRNEGGDPMTWTRHTIDDDFGGAWPLSLGDLNIDGTVDVVAGGYAVGELRWWKNHPIWLMPAFAADPTTGHAPLQVQFTDQTSAWPPVVSWAWDLDGDGTVDSNAQNPSWLYGQPGVYSVTLTTVNDSLTQASTQSDFVRVFDGESALRFNASSSAVTCASASSLNLTEALTVEAWIKPEGWGEVGGNGYGRIIDKNRLALYLSGHSTFGDSCLVFMLFTDSGGMSASMTPTGSVTLGEWQHVAATYDAQTSLVTIYINGIAQPLEQTRPPSGDITDNEAHELLIGNAANLGSTFDGAIDEVRVWNIPRTGDEIRSSLGATLPGPADGLVGYWPMNEGSGGEILDYSDQGNHGTISDAAWVQGTSFEVPVTADVHRPLPRRIRILEAWPNPVVASTFITIDVPQGAKAHLTISDLAGRIVRSLDADASSDGVCTVAWNGRDAHGSLVPEGAYVIRASTGVSAATARCVVVR